MYIVLQELAVELTDDKLHVVADTPPTVKVPPRPPSSHLKVPLGDVFVPPLVSATFPVKVIIF